MSENIREITCIKYKENLPGLEKLPFPGDVGEKIFNLVSKKAWLEWQEDMQIKVINEYRLNLGSKEDYEFLVKQMLAFLSLSDEKVMEVENPDRGK